MGSEKCNEWSEINKKIWNLWLKYDDSCKGRMPLFYKLIQEKSILFIGINPSFKVEKIKELIKEIPIEIDNVEEYFSFEHHKNSDKNNFVDLSCKLDGIARKQHPYFEKFKRISEFTNLSWDHVDLFFIRETSQNELKNIVGIKFDKQNNPILNEINEFGREQLNLSKDIIEQSKPKLIIVANVLASRIFKQKYEVSFNKEGRYYFVKLNGDDVPVVFSSMLTGQRALDVFSYERLEWYIKDLLDSKYASQ